MNASTSLLLLTALGLGASYGALGAAAWLAGRVSATPFLAVGHVAVVGVVVGSLTGLVVDDWLAIAVGLALAGVLAAAVDLVSVERTGADPVARVISLAVAAAVVAGWAGRVLGATTAAPGGGSLAADSTRALVGGVLLTAVLAATIGWTDAGRRIRLVGSAPEVAELSGVGARRVRLVTMAVAGVVAALSARLIAPIVFVGLPQAAGLTLRAVVVAMLAGRARPAWIVGGGLGLGLVDVVGQQLWQAGGGDVAVAVAALLALLLRGQAGRQAWERVW